MPSNNKNCFEEKIFIKFSSDVWPAFLRSGRDSIWKLLTNAVAVREV
jgi:hypothetical protein